MMYLHGIDRIKDFDGILKNRRIGLITNPTGVDMKLASTINIMCERYNVVKLYAPEHGVRGAIQAGEKVDFYVDEKTGLPVTSLFRQQDWEDGKSTFDEIDCAVFDIQDVGARYYTYIYTLANAMKLCKKREIPMVVLDRYNPLGLTKLEGTLLDERFSSLVGMYELPTRHAMTIGEFARYINAEKGIDCELYVALCGGLSRTMDYRTCNALWVQPSPNIPTWETALYYIGTCLFEGTNLSEGRGTTKPFEIVGAPWLKSDEVTEFMNEQHIGGVIFRSTYFTPTFSKHAGKLCRGVQLHITDYDEFASFRCGLLLLDTIRRMHCDGEERFEFNRPSNGNTYFIDHLIGSADLRKKNFNPEAFMASEKKKIDAFKIKTEKYRLYE